MTKRRAPKTAPEDDETTAASNIGTDDSEPVTVRRTLEGHGYFTPVQPAAVGRLSTEAAELLAELQDVVITRRELLLQVDELVEGLREHGVSWGLIGWSVGTSSEAARKRWS